MSGPSRRSLRRDGSISSLEHSINILAEPQAEPITIYPGPGPQGAQMSKVDIDLVNRLQKLKHSGKENLPTEDEVSARLAALKGLPSDYYQRKRNIAYEPLKHVSETQQADSLFNQIAEEVAIDAKRVKPEDELEARLAKLRGSDARPAPVCSGGGAEAQGQAGAPGSYSIPSGAFINNDLGDELGDINMSEVESLMLEATKAEDTAQKMMKDLHEDPEIAAALASIPKKDPEKYSESDDSDVPDAKMSLEDYTNNEVQSIVNMYSKKGEKRKHRKKNHKSKHSSADSDSSSSESESSESEKISRSESDPESD